jgi:hypothetical protein
MTVSVYCHRVLSEIGKETKHQIYVPLPASIVDKHYTSTHVAIAYKFPVRLTAKRLNIEMVKTQNYFLPPFTTRNI